MGARDLTEGLDVIDGGEFLKDNSSAPPGAGKHDHIMKDKSEDGLSLLNTTQPPMLYIFTI